MNTFDRSIISFLNGFAHRSWAFDGFVAMIGRNYLIKTGVVITTLCWAWFRRDRETHTRREIVLFGALASCFAVLVARVLSFLLPFRERPPLDTGIHFVVPYAIDPESFLGWNAFPSDNAALYFGLAACLYLISRRAGLLAFAYTCVVVGFARVYLGYHHPTDILGGALIGIGAVSLVNIPSLKAAVVGLPMRLERETPELFYPAAFLLLFMIATTFEPLYPVATYVVTSARAIRNVRLGMYLVSWAELTVALSAVYGLGWIGSRWVRARKSRESWGPATVALSSGHMAGPGRGPSAR